MTDEEKHIERIRRDIPEPDANPLPFIMICAAGGCVFWAVVFSTLLF